MIDFRDIEHELCRFFAARGAMPTCAAGNAYVGWAETESTTKTAKNEFAVKGSLVVHVDVKVSEDPDTKVICLTDLAQDLSQYIQDRK